MTLMNASVKGILKTKLLLLKSAMMCLNNGCTPLTALCNVKELLLLLVERGLKILSYDLLLLHS